MNPVSKPKIISIFVSTFALAATAKATVATLESVQAAQAGLTYQYTFEAEINADRMKQSAGSGTTANLELKRSSTDYNLSWGTNPNTGAPAYTSFDESSYAVFTKRGSAANWGASLIANDTSRLTLSTSGTIVYLFRAATYDQAAFGIGGSANDQSDSRWYFLYNGSASDTSNTAYTTLGANVKHAILGGSTGVAYNTGDWYYVAQTWSISGGVVTTSAWAANLTKGDTTLTQTLDGGTNAHGGGLNYQLALGSSNGGTAYFAGGFDAVAIYNTALTAADFQSQLSAVYSTIPEPSTTVFGIGLGALALGFLLKRKRTPVPATR
ncbi:PEP-CTERM motif protein [Opitutaceae bacterium TAV1]|nr:PEP-CTERM motif protein [Opitutaceae bacterium TAV1]